MYFLFLEATKFGDMTFFESSVNCKMQRFGCMFKKKGAILIIFIFGMEYVVRNS